MVTTIEGNYGDKVTQVTYNKDTKKIVGYAAPLYGYRIGYYRLDSTMRLRARATTESDTLTTIPYDTVVNITKIDGDWGYVTYDGYTGWMNLNYSTYLVQDDTVRIPETALFLVADVSQWNPASRFDWEQLKENGVEAVIMRIGGRGYNADKTLYRDTAFLQHYKNAKAAGLHVGVYFFSYALTRAQAKEEAQMTIDILAENNCVLDMPVFIDIEDLSYDHQHEWAGKEVCSMVANTFCDTIADAGYYPGIYCNKYFAENLLDANVFAGRAAWIAHWGVAQCGYQGRYDLWQFTETGRVSGYSDNLDLSYCYTDFPALIGSSGMSGYYGEHTPGAWTVTKQSTCTGAGERVRKCADCGIVLITESITGSHTESGTYILLSKTGTRVGDTVNDNLRAALHGEKESNYESVYLPTFEENGGTMLTYCTTCGKVLTTKYSYGTEPHNDTITETTPATCLTEGLCTVMCADCGRTLSQTLLPVADHPDEITEIIKATCTQEGTRTTICAACGKTVRTEYVAPSDHVYGAGIEVTPVSVRADGKVQYVCRICGETRTETIPAPKFGDIDGDGDVTAEDARLALRAAVELETLTEMQKMAGDINNSGDVESADSRYILRFAVSLDDPKKIMDQFYK